MLHNINKARSLRIGIIAQIICIACAIIKNNSEAHSERVNRSFYDFVCKSSWKIRLVQYQKMNILGSYLNSWTFA